MSDLVYLSDVAAYNTVGGMLPAGVHRSLEVAARALEEVAGLHGLGFHHATRVKELGEGTLRTAGVLALFTIGETAWSVDQRRVIETRTKQGQLGLLGLHSATDSAYGWPALGELLGARFAGHPVTAALPVTVVDGNHPATSHLPSPWTFEEELYLFREFAPQARVLLGVRQADLPAAARRALAEHPRVSGDAELAELLPLAWCLERNGARSFYTVLGHFLAAYEDTRYLQHLSGALEWLLAGPRRYPG